MWFWKGRRRVLKIKVGIEGNVFELEAEATYADVRPALETFFEIQKEMGKVAQVAIDRLVDRIKDSNDSLATAVDNARS
jgi:hypothetical protein